MRVNKRFRSWRKALGLSQKAMGKKLGGIYQTLVSKLETGAQPPSLELAALIEVLSASWAEGPITMREWVTLDHPEATPATSSSQAQQPPRASERMSASAGPGLEAA